VYGHTKEVIVEELGTAFFDFRIPAFINTIGAFSFLFIGT
jgi:hypothetical protein